MNSGKGFMIITDFNWYSFLKENYLGGLVNFWRRDTRKFNILEKGDRIYFLNKKDKSLNGRKIIGMGRFIEYRVETVEKAWIKHQSNNGYDNIKSMLKTLNNGKTNIKSKDSKIGCIILNDIIFFDEYIDPKEVYINFEKNIQMGKSISLKEENLILKCMDGIGNGVLDIDEEIALTGEEDFDEGREINRKVNVRVNQDKFRRKLLRKYKNCLICGIDKKDLLRASHSKPWKVSNSKEKVDVNNGLLLCANHDCLYDRFLITFDDNGKIIISSNIDTENRKRLNINEEITIDVSDYCKKYIEWHRCEFFIRQKI